MKPHMMDISGVMQGAADWCQGNKGSRGDRALAELRREQGERSSFALLCVHTPAKPNALPLRVPVLKTAWISPWPSQFSL